MGTGCVLVPSSALILLSTQPNTQHLQNDRLASEAADTVAPVPTEASPPPLREALGKGVCCLAGHTQAEATHGHSRRQVGV